MLNVVLKVVTTIFIIWLISRILAWTIVYFIKRKLKIDLKIGNVGFFTFSKIIIVPKNGITVEVERVWLSSSLVNSDIKKVLSVCIGDVRIHADLAGIKNKPASHANAKETNSSQKEHHSWKKLPSIAYCLKFTGIYVEAVDVIAWNDGISGSMLHGTIQECSILGRLQQTSLELNVTLNTLSGKVLHGSKGDHVASDEQTCLAEASGSMSLALLLDTEDLLPAEVVEVSVLKSHIKINQGLLRKLPKGGTVSQKKNASASKMSNLAFMVLPKKLEVKIKSTDLMLEDNRSHEGHASHDVKTCVESLTVNMCNCLLEDNLVKTSLTLQVANAHCNTSHSTLFSVTNICSKFEMDSTNVNVGVHVTNGFIGYCYDSVKHWSDILQRPQREVTQEKNRSSRLMDILQTRSVNINMDLQHCSASLATKVNTGITAGVTVLKFAVTLKSGLQDIGILGLDVRWDMEVTSFYCCLTEAALPYSKLCPKYHHWKTVVYIGTHISKIQKYSNQLTVDTMLDSLQLEWSSDLLSVISNLHSTLIKSSQNKVPLDFNLPSSSDEDGATSNIRVTSKGNTRAKNVLLQIIQEAQINFQCTSVNVYLCNNEVQTMLRCDTLNWKQRLEEPGITIQGLKLTYGHQVGKARGICRSADMQEYLGHLKEINISYRWMPQVIEIKAEKDVYFLWKSGMHMCILESFREMGELRQLLATGADSKSSSHLSSGGVNLTLSVATCTHILIAIQLSNEHNVSFSSHGLDVKKCKNNYSATTSEFIVTFDSHDIFTLKTIQLDFMAVSEQLKYERMGIGTLKQPTNRALVLKCDSCHIVFPYKYDFSACFQKLVNLNKWRKLVHRVTKKPFTADSPLPPDIHFKMKVFVVQLCDDPFEVKLSDNYELMSDESIENEKRVEAMDKRIAELRKHHRFLPGGKVEELYSSLSKKNSEVYIRRSNQLYTESQMRTKLFTWTMEQLDIQAFVDPTLHGKENVVKNMREIDKDSPYPEEGLEFTTLWCRHLNVSTEHWTVQLRDYPMYALDVRELHLWGRLIGAEQTPTKRAIRTDVFDMEAPWSSVTVERSMPSLKFYHDFSADMSQWNMAYGPCWDPAVSQYNLNLNMINRPSLDPSQQLPFWDKARLLLHGRLTMSVGKMRWIYHASLDPYNTTELMDWTWSNLILDWTNGKWILKSDLDIYARTASKYDDCRLLHLPNLRFCVRLEWLSVGDPNDHHSVMPCAPDKVPEFSMQEHDSYRAFRSQNMNMSVSFETRPKNDGDIPSCQFYASTLRWMDKVKMCMNHVSRPIRRGKLYNTTAPSKPKLSRHFKNAQLDVRLHQFQTCYWMSFSKKNGFEFSCANFSLSVGPQLSLVTPDDGLIHRKQTNWTIRNFNCDLNDANAWLCSANAEGQEDNISLRDPVDRSFFLSIEKVTYHRDDRDLKLLQEEALSLDSDVPVQYEEKAKHEVQVHNLKCAWTTRNRNVAFSLFDGYRNAQNLKKNVSADALKGFKVDASQTPATSRGPSNACTPVLVSNSANTSSSPWTKIQTGPAYSMLQKLVEELDSKNVAVHEEVSGGNVQVEQLHGISACQTDDVRQRNWHIELYNSQVMLKGSETAGYVIVSAAKTQILSCDHQAVWKERQLKSKTTWMGSVDCMQYYATVDSEGDKPVWLTKEDVEDHSESGCDLPGFSEMIGSCQSVGGVVNDTINSDGLEAGELNVQLQRIISRCKCQFFYASYGEVDSDTVSEVPPPPPAEESKNMVNTWREGADSFTLLHHDLNICTNSVQYAMILDIVNNLLLYVQPKKKELNEKLQSLRFKLQLSSSEDQRTPILQRQNSLRKLLQKLRQLERQLYLLQKASDEMAQSDDSLKNSQDLLFRLSECKQQQSVISEELAIMVGCFKENQIIQSKAFLKASKTQQALETKRYEICFKHAEWRMNEEDGQIGIADLVLRDFLYTKANHDNDSGTHQLELGYVKVTNLLPNSIYRVVLQPQESRPAKTNRQMCLRILCKFMAPVGGISVRDHLEVNVVPLKIELTRQFYRTVMKFFFPGKNIDRNEDQSAPPEDDNHGENSGTNKSKKKAKQRSGVQGELFLDDIDKMKQRAARNNMFVYIKIPEVPLRVSYKGEKEKNMTDVHEFTFVLPTLEYHSQTWTWLDLLMAIKSDTKKTLISQAIKQKLHMKSRVPEEAVKADVQQEDKAKMLLGAKLFSGSEKPATKKSLFGKSSK